MSIPPLSTRLHNYEVPGGAMRSAGTYTVTVKLKAGMIPINLLDAIKAVGFDYGLSLRTIAERVVAGHEVLWEKSRSIDIH